MRPSARPAPLRTTGVEAVSLLGDTLRPPALAPEVRRRFEERLAEAHRAAAAAPGDVEALIWLGRRTAYLGRYREAIAIYTRALAGHPAEPRLYRHRGHRWITVRQLGRAIADLERAAALVAGRPDEVEPDGLPNARGIPTSTLQSNIHYHLGLARYLSGDYAGALEAYHACLGVSRNPDMLVATSYWLYLTLRRLGRAGEARAVLGLIRADLDVIENHAYHRLLLAFAGAVPIEALGAAGETGGDPLEEVTTGYGVGAYYLLAGDTARAVATFHRVLRGGNWPAFGFIAAEAEVAALGRGSGSRP